MPSIRISAIVPPGAAAERACAATARVCAAAGESQPAPASQRAAANSASKRSVTRFGYKAPTPDSLLLAHPPDARSGHEAFHHIDDPYVHEIVPRGEDHQCQHQRQADAEAVFLCALAQRLTADRLSGIERQMPTVKHGH